MDYTDLATFVNSGADDTTYVQSCWSQAVALVDGYVGNRDVPVVIRDRCYIMCGSELFHARNAPNGIAQFNDMTGAPIRIARDPMTPVYSLLQSFIPMGVPVWVV